jgi:O-antigen/teichoic acid export membrane protein
MALAIATLPLDRLNELVNRVTPGLFSSVQNDKTELERYVRRGSQALSLFLFPVAVGLALVAGDMVPVVLGARWQPAVAPLQLLSLSAVIRALVPILNQVLVSTGNSRTGMRATMAAALIMPVAFYFGTRWGLAGVAWMWLALYPFVIIPGMVLPAFRAAGVKVGTYLNAVRPAAEGALVMAAVLLLSPVD